MCKSEFSISEATALGTSTFVFWGTIFLLRFGLFVTPERAFLEAQHEVALQSRGRPLAEHWGTQFRSGARGAGVVAAEKGASRGSRGQASHPTSWGRRWWGTASSMVRGCFNSAHSAAR